MKRNNTFPTLLSAACLILLGTGLLSTTTTGLAIPHAQYGYQVLLGLGAGLTFSSATVLTALEAAPEDRAIAQGAVDQSRVLGGSIGVAVARAVLNAKLSALQGPLSASQLSDLRRSLGVAVQLTPEQWGLVREVFAQGFDRVFRVGMGVAVVLVLASVGTWQARPKAIGEMKDALERALEERNGKERKDQELGGMADAFEKMLEVDVRMEKVKAPEVVKLR